MTWRASRVRPFRSVALATAGIAVRLGDDLRRSAVVHTGPRVDAQRVRGLYAAFLAGAK